MYDYWHSILYDYHVKSFIHPQDQDKFEKEALSKRVLPLSVLGFRTFEHRPSFHLYSLPYIPNL